MAEPLPDKTHEIAKYAHSAPLLSCRFDPTGRFVFCGTQDNKVTRWTLADGAKLEYAGHDSWVRALGFTPDGKVLLTGGFDGRLIWWEAEAAEAKPIRTVEAHKGWLRAMCVSPDGKMVATCGNDNQVKIWSTESGELLRELPGHEKHVYNVAWSPDGTTLVSGDLGARFLVWNPGDGAIKGDFKVEALSKYDEGFRADYGGPHCLEYSSDGTKIFAGGITNVTNAFAGVGNPILSQVEVATGKVIHNHQAKGKPNGTLWGLAVPREPFVIGVSGGGGGGHIFFWKLDSEEEFHTQGLPNNARDLSLHVDGVRLAVAHQDNHVRLYEMKAAG